MPNLQWVTQSCDINAPGTGSSTSVPCDHRLRAVLGAGYSITNYLELLTTSSWGEASWKDAPSPHLPRTSEGSLPKSFSTKHNAFPLFPRGTVPQGSPVVLASP